MTSNVNSPSDVETKKKENYLRQVQAELKKVNWTTKEELIVYTKIVLGATLIFGAAIYFTDLAIKLGLNVIHMLAKFIIG